MIALVAVTVLDAYRVRRIKMSWLGHKGLKRKAHPIWVIAIIIAALELSIVCVCVCRVMCLSFLGLRCAFYCALCFALYSRDRW